MAKTIKFNLVCDDKPIRTLDDLRNNFCVDDIITYYRNGLLERWLTVRGFTEELEQLKAIAPADDRTIIHELVKIFHVDDDPTDIDRDTYIFTFRQEQAAELKRQQEQGYKHKYVIDDYHAGYEALIDTIIDNKNDMPKIKAAVQEIDERYHTLFCMHSGNLLNLFLERAPMAVFAMLMRPNMRKVYLPEDFSSNTFMLPMRENVDDEHNTRFDTMGLYKQIRSLLNYNKLKEILADNLKEFAGITDGYWKDIQPKGQTCMILSIEGGNYVRPAGQSGSDLAANDICGKFVILDGIDYKSNNASQKLLYLEV